MSNAKLGRPKKYTTAPIKMTLMLDKESRRRLEKDSKALGISMSEYVQLLIKQPLTKT